MARNLMSLGDRPNLSRPDDPFGTLRRELTRMFDEAFGGFLSGSGDRSGSLIPRVDMRERDDAIEIEAELPGVDEKDIEVTLDNDTLTIKAEKKLENRQSREGYYVSERSYGMFLRSLHVPAGIDPNKVNASFSKGVLKIVLPKPADAQGKSKKIEVKAGPSAGAPGPASGPTGSVEQLAQKAWEGAQAGPEAEDQTKPR